MEANVEKLFSIEILQEAALRFGAGTENTKKRMPLFLRLRDITLYTVFYKKMPRADLEGKFKDTLLAMKNRIINKEPIIDLDYKKIIKDL